MAEYRIQSLDDLEADMRAVARREKPAPADAAVATVESVDVLIRLLTPENRRLLAIIRDRRPQSIAEELAGDHRACRAQSCPHPGQAGGRRLRHHADGQPPEGAERGHSHAARRDRPVLTERPAGNGVAGATSMPSQRRELATETRPLLEVNDVNRQYRCRAMASIHETEGLHAAGVLRKQNHAEKSTRPA